MYLSLRSVAMDTKTSHRDLFGLIFELKKSTFRFRLNQFINNIIVKSINNFFSHEVEFY